VRIISPSISDQYSTAMICGSIWGMHAVVAISELVTPYEANAMRSYPVSTRINHVANDDEECSRPVVIADAQNRLFLWKSVMCVARETIHRRVGKWNT
jgi:hypothetical protein